MTKVSVIVPIYNSEKFLEECLLSLKNQTLDNVEFILVDDGSTDKSKSICSKFLDDKRFTYFYKENGGQVSAYLYGFEHSKGEYIGFVDADDFADKDMFAKMYKKANENDADIVISLRNDFSVDINNYSSERPLLDEGLYTDEISKILDLTLPPFNSNHMHNSRWNKIYKREIFGKNTKYCLDKVRTLEDRFIVPACIFSSKSIYLLNENLYFYRHSSETSHLKSRLELYEIIKKLSIRQKEMLIENNYYEKYKDKYEIAQLNYLNIFVERNIITHGKFKDKLFYSKQIIKDRFYKDLVKKHSKDMNGKKGKLLKICFKLNSSFLLTLMSYLRKN